MSSDLSGSIPSGPAVSLFLPRSGTQPRCRGTDRRVDWKGKLSSSPCRRGRACPGAYLLLPLSTRSHVSAPVSLRPEPVPLGGWEAPWMFKTVFISTEHLSPIHQICYLDSSVQCCVCCSWRVFPEDAAALQPSALKGEQRRHQQLTAEHMKNTFSQTQQSDAEFRVSVVGYGSGKVQKMMK